MLTQKQKEDLINEIGQVEFDNLVKEYGEKVVEAALKAEIQPEHIEESYVGQYPTDEDFAYEFYTDIYGYVLTKPGLYINWKLTAGSLMTDFVEDSNYYFKIL